MSRAEFIDRKADPKACTASNVAREGYFSRRTMMCPSEGGSSELPPLATATRMRPSPTATSRAGIGVLKVLTTRGDAGSARSTITSPTTGSAT